MVLINYAVTDTEKAKKELEKMGYIFTGSHFVKGSKAVYLIKKGVKG